MADRFHFKQYFGMSQVGSVNFAKNIQQGIIIKRGDRLGNFLFGGSDFIRIFQKRARFALLTLTEEDNGQSFQPILMGENSVY